MDPSKLSNRLAWFCLRTRPKHEHIAAAYLSRECKVEVYLPRIRFKRLTRRGPVWFTEALFPSYLFARLDAAAGLRKFHHAGGVQGIVHFGGRFPTIPNETVRELQATIDAKAVYTVQTDLQPGDSVQLVEGAFQGLQAVVTRLMPARDRVAVLLHFLGRQTLLDLPATSLVPVSDARTTLFTNNPHELCDSASPASGSRPNSPADSPGLSPKDAQAPR